MLEMVLMMLGSVALACLLVFWAAARTTPTALRPASPPPPTRQVLQATLVHVTRDHETLQADYAQVMDAMDQLRPALAQVTRERDDLRKRYEVAMEHLVSVQTNYNQVREYYEQAKAELQLLRRRPAPEPASEALVRELTRLLTVGHPDKWRGESAVATALTQELLAIRERLQAHKS